MYWYEQDVKHLEGERAQADYTSAVIFYGSSTFRLWDTLATDFPDFNVRNYGFGGSTLAACAWFFERLIIPVKPQALLVYAGDNDLGDGRHPEEILLFFQQLIQKAEVLGNIPCYFISLKPSPARWHMAEQFRYTNNLIKSEIIRRDTNWKFVDVFYPMLEKSGQPLESLYTIDGLHLSEEGYLLWSALLNVVLARDLKT